MTLVKAGSQSLVRTKERKRKKRRRKKKRRGGKEILCVLTDCMMDPSELPQS